MNEFKAVDLYTLKDNPFHLLDKEWMLITAGNSQSFNTMTASWGGVGILWNKPVSFCFVRPQRHTYQFMEESSVYTLSFFSEEYRDMLNLCGKKSGKDTDKIKESGLIPKFSESGAIYFEQARLVMECKKLYADLIKAECAIKNTVDFKKIYPIDDFHKFYIGEIISCTERL